MPSREFEFEPPGCFAVVAGYAVGCYLAMIPFFFDAPTWSVLCAPVAVPLGLVIMAMFGNWELSIGFCYLLMIWLTMCAGGVGIVRIYEDGRFRIWPIAVVLAGYLLMAASWLNSWLTA